MMQRIQVQEERGGKHVLYSRKRLALCVMFFCMLVVQMVWLGGTQEVYAQEAYQGFYYTYNGDGHDVYITITGYYGTEEKITIPSEIDGYKVRRIEGDAFGDCVSLTRVTIPEGVNEIGSYAFRGCSSLTSVTIPEGVTSIDGAFNGCSSLTSVTIPEGVTSIDGAFNGCSSLTSVTIPEGVTEIGGYAFYGCRSLASITIPEGVTEIGRDAFYGCRSLASVTIPEGVTSIGENAFSDCSSLTSVTIPEGLTEIGECAFFYCSSLTSVTIPEGVTSIGEKAFGWCSSLTSVTIPEGVAFIGEGVFSGCSSLASVTIPEGVTEIGRDAFYDCRSLTSVTIPESVTSIDEDAFSGCSLREIYYTGSKKQWDKINSGLRAACIHCSDGTIGFIYEITDGEAIITGYSYDEEEIQIPSRLDGYDVTGIGASAFRNCSNLANVTIPVSIKSIGESAFENCSGLTTVYYGNDWPDVATAVNSWNSISIGGGNNAIKEAVIHTGVYNKDFALFRSFQLGIYGQTVSIERYGGTETELTIPSEIHGYKVRTIGRNAFGGCSSLTSVTIPEGVTSIEGDAFLGCSSLRDVYYSGTKTQWNNFQLWLSDVAIHCSDETIGFIYEVIDGEAIITKYSSGEEEIQIPSRLGGYDVTGIGAFAFRNCSNLKSVTIPASIKSIGESAFENCSGLTIVNYGPDRWYRVEESINSWNSISMGDGNRAIKEAIIHARGYDKNFTFFHSFQLEIEGQTVSIEGYSGTETELTVPSEIRGYKVRRIGFQAFEDCVSLTRAEIPEGVTEIGRYAFSGCSSLTSVTIPKGVTSIWGAFSGCSSLASVTIPEGVTKIGGYAFSGCSLTSVTIPKSVTSIGSDAFASCSNLANIYYSGSMSQWREISSGFYDLKVPVHCSDGVITYTSTGGSEPYPVPSPDTDSDDNIDTYIDYPGTDLGGVLVKPGLPCIVNGFTISLVSFEWDSAYGIYELTLNAKNNTNHILPWQDIHYRSYKDENTLVQSSFIDLESLYPGENYTTSIEIYSDEKIIVIGDGAVYCGPKISANISKAQVSLSQSYYTYDGTAKKPGVTVTQNGVVLQNGNDYTVEYKNNKNAGTASVVVTGAGSFKGTVSTTFTIAKAKSTIRLEPKVKVHTGKKISIGKAQVTGSTGIVTYRYYTDAACTKQIDASRVQKAGVYYVKATVAADSNHTGKTSKAVKLTIIKPGKGIISYLKGTWDNGKRYAKFTKKYCKYYERKNGKLKYTEKYKIAKIKNLKNKKGKLIGCHILLKKGKYKHSYRLLFKNPNMLECYDNWKCSGKNYRGGSSLVRD